MCETSLTRKILALPILLLFIFAGCGKDLATTWEPHVMKLSFSKDGESLANLRLIPQETPVPEIVIDKGQVLEIHELVCGLLPTTKKSHGHKIQYSDLPEVPETALDVDMKVTVRMHKHFNCYDQKDMLETGWVSVNSSEWKVPGSYRQWKVESDWDYLRIQVQVRKRNQETIRISDYSQDIALIPGSAAGRAAWNVRHGGPNALMDFINGRDADRPCSEEQH